MSDIYQVADRYKYSLQKFAQLKVYVDKEDFDDLEHHFLLLRNGLDNRLSDIRHAIQDIAQDILKNISDDKFKIISDFEKIIDKICKYIDTFNNQIGLNSDKLGPYVASSDDFNLKRLYANENKIDHFIAEIMKILDNCNIPIDEFALKFNQHEYVLSEEFIEIIFNNLNDILSNLKNILVLLELTEFAVDVENIIISVKSNKSKIESAMMSYKKQEAVENLKSLMDPEDQDDEEALQEAMKGTYFNAR